MERIAIPGAEIYYKKNVLSPREATTLFNELRAWCAWERRRSSFGYAVPRDEAYYGDRSGNQLHLLGSRRKYKLGEVSSPRAECNELGLSSPRPASQPRALARRTVGNVLQGKMRAVLGMKVDC